ncbi:hypothetical protein DICPUDRAFT_33595 [Dictyostelium purpureum]|uniref:Short-chain dehydrogenase/reductase SDR n=1 Tax=Dictyostelium purpureum TaxID=5786 RepID=F0ZL44_DICPU|nr:uncharacterized protein DICPUDRAFT_33595 [Dictyostelium purpureum]EGC35342.1 hypothetical protein DICPUDRAFT_33595 [Dictyostelium purpureum]|eukprot:XP_003288149.1 hypothetical protein DICPUDRAFT_33595 [Dictyostelium purpureum]
MESINNNNSQDKVWYITGTSTGIGLDLLELLLNNGNRVTAITRSPDQTIDELKKKGTKNLDKLLAIKTDITNDESVKESIKKTIQEHGRIDVVVNNSGYGLLGAVEELSAEDIQKIYAVNVFGVYNVLRHTTPYLRAQRSGLILNISSYLGYSTIGGKYSAYESTKHALNGITLSLQKELEPFNVSVVLIGLGGVRTSFVNGGNFAVTKNLIEEYNTNQLIEMFKKYSPFAKGDPVKVAQTIYNLSNSSKLPVSLDLGSDSYQIAKATFENRLKGVEENHQLTLSTDF